MTIAAVYVTPEGIVFGADSTASALISAGGVPSYHFFNHNQKLLELGESSTFGVVTWGLASLDGVSYRTLVARLADDLDASPAATPSEVAKRWIEIFYPRYVTTVGGSVRRKELLAKVGRTDKEEKELRQIEWNFVVGFCIGGYCLPSREPRAFEIIFQPGDSAPPNPREIKPGEFTFWGAPNMIERLIWGRDPRLADDIKSSGKWSGSDEELSELLEGRFLEHPSLPIRDAIDFVHTCIYSTIKAMKFSDMPQICGGPIELAVITTDRHFRWVRHKSWDTAVDKGE